MAHQIPVAISDIGRAVRGLFRRQVAEPGEGIQFVRFQDEPTYETTEMKPVSNGKAVVEADGFVVTDDEVKVPDFQSVPEEGKDTDKNKITEWQAGWNVTNAIQVGTRGTSQTPKRKCHFDEIVLTGYPGSCLTSCAYSCKDFVKMTIPSQLRAYTFFRA